MVTYFLGNGFPFWWISSHNLYFKPLKLRIYLYEKNTIMYYILVRSLWYKIDSLDFKTYYLVDLRDPLWIRIFDQKLIV